MTPSKRRDMFRDIPQAVRSRMEVLESLDQLDRLDGTPRLQRLRQIPPETGRFLAILAAGSPNGEITEIGTSAGYSALWISLACEATGRRLRTFEVLADKARLARETFTAAERQHLVELIEDDALTHLPSTRDIAFCFLDAEKELYADCIDAVVPNLVSGGLLVADNVVSHRESLESVVAGVMSDARLDAVVVPIGKGLVVCRKI